MPEPIFMILGTYITAPEPISTAYLNKKFWEELIAYIPLIRYGPHRKAAVA
jgi:hypothetical protein